MREDGRPVRATDEQSAVEKWAARDDAESVEYLIAGGSDATVLVVLHGSDDTPKSWLVSGEAVPVYHAMEDTGNRIPRNDHAARRK